jgi:hypothetical protein
MVFQIRVIVVNQTMDTDPFTGRIFYQIALGIKVPIPVEKPPPGAPQLVQSAWKHLLHVFVPRENWVNQYTMGQEFDLTVNDEGEVTLKRRPLQVEEEGK